jgi:hypothetical protein
MPIQFFGILPVLEVSGKTPFDISVGLKGTSRSFVARGPFYAKVESGNNLPTQKALHFAVGRLNLANNKVNAEIIRCSSPLELRHGESIPCQFTVTGEVLSSSFDKNEITLKAQEYANKQNDAVTVKLALNEKESSRFSALTVALKPGKIISVSGHLKDMELEKKTITLEHIDITIIGGPTKVVQQVATAEVSGDEWFLTENYANSDTAFTPKQVSVEAPIVVKVESETALKSEAVDESSRTKRKRVIDDCNDEYSPPGSSESTSEEATRPKRKRGSKDNSI